MKVVAAIPALNEEISIGSVILRTEKYVDQVIVVDDGSTDRTAETAGLAGAQVIRHQGNMGYGTAIRACLDAARKTGADILVILDADGQHDPEQIPGIIRPILAEKADVVIGSRTLAPNRIPLYRKAGMKILDLATNAFSQKVSDTQSGFRAYSKKALAALTLTEKGMGVSSEILITAREKGLIVREVPIRVRYDTRKPNQGPLKHGLTVLAAIAKARIRKKPRH